MPLLISKEGCTTIILKLKFIFKKYFLLYTQQDIVRGILSLETVLIGSDGRLHWACHLACPR